VPTNVGEAKVKKQIQRVLVVDDDDLIRETMTAALEDDGYIVTEARDGAAALKILYACSKPMVVLLDLRMPKLDGAEVLDAVAADHRLAKQNAFILVTADNKTITLTFAHLLAQLDVPVLKKPFDLDELLDLVADAAGRLDAVS
jgi:CheY-like chemotaxis protein